MTMTISGHGLMMGGVLVLALSTVGCSTSGFMKGENTSASMEDTKHELTRAHGQISRALGSVDALVAATQTEPKKAFKEFKHEIGTTDYFARRVGERADEMRANSHAYFAAWDLELAQIQNAEIKQASQDRRQQTAMNYAAIQDSMVGARDAYIPFIKDLRDLERYFNQDLSWDGAQAAAPLLKTARQNGVVVQQHIGQVIRELEKAASSLAQ
jgi:hypothetical protein